MLNRSTVSMRRRLKPITVPPAWNPALIWCYSFTPEERIHGVQCVARTMCLPMMIAKISESKWCS